MATSSNAGLNILVVDDEEFVRETFLAFLELDGHTVTLANDGPQALQLFEPGKYQIVFTDLSMPGIPGDRLAVEIKQRSPNQLVVLVTSFAANLNANCRHAIDLLMAKPFSGQQIQQAVEAVSR